MVFTSNTVSDLRSIAEALDQVARNESEILIGELDGYQYYLGPEAPAVMDWSEAIKWCKSLGDGYELPSLDVLRMCYSNNAVRQQFQRQWYWSSTEVSSTPTNAWLQGFTYGHQFDYLKSDSNYVRAVRKVPG